MPLASKKEEKKHGMTDGSHQEVSKVMYAARLIYVVITLELLPEGKQAENR